MSWWSTLPSQIDPVAFSIFSLEIRYYGLMYLTAFLTAYLLMRWRIKKKEVEGLKKYKQKEVTKNLDDIFTWSILGLLIGARLGYFLFYQTIILFTKPWQVLWPFSEAGDFIGFAGMSFHGGLIGIIIATFIIIKKRKLNYLTWAELAIPTIPIAYTWGRIGNWLNGELWGRVTTHPIGQIFPNDPDKLLRHPSQLYEAFLEGIIVFLIIWPFRNNPWMKKNVLWLYLILYSLARFVSEFYREPDTHIGLHAFSLSTGQYLALATVLFAIVAAYISHVRQTRS